MSTSDPGILTEEIVKLLLSVLPIWRDQIGNAAGQTEESITDLTETFSQMATEINRLPDTVDKKALQNQITPVITSLQFSDRISQILKSVMQNMNLLENQLSSINENPGDSSMPEIVDWLESLRQTYTTPEQFTTHDRNLGHNPDPGDVTFF